MICNNFLGTFIHKWIKYPFDLKRNSIYLTQGYLILKKGRGGICYNNDAIKIKETLQDKIALQFAKTQADRE